MTLILDDHPLARQGLCSLIKRYQNDEEILQAGTVREAVSLMGDNTVGLVFIDLILEKESGFSLLSWIREKDYETKTFIVTASSRQSDFKRAQELGVDAYVLKDAFIDEILYGLRTVEHGGKFYSAALVEQLSKISDDERVLKTLTSREMDVFLLLGQGYNNVAISKALYISEGTTKKHISSIFGKLELHSRVEAVLFASRNSYSIRIALSKLVKGDSRGEAGS